MLALVDLRYTAISAVSCRKIETTTTTATTCCPLPPATETSSECHHPELSPSRALGSGLVVAKWGLGSGLVVAKEGLVVAKEGLVVAW